MSPLNYPNFKQKEKEENSPKIQYKVHNETWIRQNSKIFSSTIPIQKERFRKLWLRVSEKLPSQDGNSQIKMVADYYRFKATNIKVKHPRINRSSQTSVPQRISHSNKAASGSSIRVASRRSTSRDSRRGDRIRGMSEHESRDWLSCMIHRNCQRPRLSVHPRRATRRGARLV